MPTWDENLRTAAENDDIEEMRKCLQNGANLNSVSKYNDSALIKAVVKKKEKAVKFLLEQPGIDLHIQGYLRGTALTYAIFSGQPTIAKMLLDKESEFKNADHPGTVHWAFMNKQDEIISLLIAKGANLNLSGWEGYQPVPERVWKPEPDPQSTPFDRESWVILKKTPLGMALYYRNEDFVKELLTKYNVNPNTLSDEVLPLELAARNNSENSVKLLLEKGADPRLLPQSFFDAENTPQTSQSMVPHVDKKNYRMLREARDAKIREEIILKLKRAIEDVVRAQPSAGSNSPSMQTQGVVGQGFFPAASSGQEAQKKSIAVAEDRSKAVVMIVMELVSSLPIETQTEIKNQFSKIIGTMTTSKSSSP